MSSAKAVSGSSRKFLPVEAKIIDELGGEAAAVAWLNTDKEIKKGLPIKDVELDDTPLWAKKLSSKVYGAVSQIAGGNNSLMTLWNPNLF